MFDFPSSLWSVFFDGFAGCLLVYFHVPLEHRSRSSASWAEGVAGDGPLQKGSDSGIWGLVLFGSERAFNSYR